MISWTEEAEQRYRRLCPQARALLGSENWPFDHSTALAYLELAHYLAAASELHTRRPLLVGIGGGQGAGKSTLTEFVSQLLKQQYGLSVQALSLDDFYCTKDQRRVLASQIHPLLATRGVPGTHELELLNQVLSGLQNGQPVTVPRFSKALDDRLPTDQWHKVKQPVDMVLLEGWCVGAQPQPQEQLAEPLNSLEREQDLDGQWRGYINQQLQTEYRALFQQLQSLVYLQVPNMEAVRQWRYQQQNGEQLSRQQVAGFVGYFERITRWMQQTLPQQADVVLALAPSHQVQEFRINAT